MDLGFEFLLPIESEISTVKFEQSIYEWQEEKFPQGQEEASFHYFKLIKSIVPEHIIPLLPDNFQKEHWLCISLIDGIDNLIEELSLNTSISVGKQILNDLLFSLLGGEEKWVIIFEPDYDCIDEVLEGNIEVAFYEIINSLTIEKKGFVIWNKI
ncbi:hypothetical protein [Elizabethkingia ursingii]|uniref:DUF695 domain-containing protein n=1 Tax=Elizabethkingia ursingii TaxID=1756150 RepID=A0ABX3N7V3_9FLAO|nr:hypothetical protein [Elizabethkingia ursingii]OPB88528.1 hypothetical protein BB021_08250 [Elizabethkingia ursingii]